MFERPSVDFSRLDTDFRPDFDEPGTLPIMSYVLFMDIVGFTRMPMDRQRLTISELQAIVFATTAYIEADSERRVICRSTGDGMALVFLNSLLAPARCAVAVAKELKHKSHVRLRMGIHSGHVYQVKDALGSADVIGEGINTAQRVMDCGDIGHILMSKEAAVLIGNLQEWKGWVHDLGPCPVKHGQMVHLFNLSLGDVGNRYAPKKLSSHRMNGVRDRLNPRRFVKLAVVLGIAAAAWQFGPRMMPSMSASAKGIWFTVFKPKTEGMLERAAEHAGRKKWKESIAEAKAALNTEGATAAQRGEAYYHIISAYYHLGDAGRAEAALKGYKAMASKLPPGDWTGAAIRREPALFAARRAWASKDWRTAARRAETVADARDSTPGQRAEAVYILAFAAKKQGSNEVAARYVIRYDEIAPKLSTSHWTREKMPEFAGAATALSPAPSKPAASKPAEDYYERVSRAHLRGDSALAARELRNLDRHSASLRVDQITELRGIQAGIQIRSAAEAFDRRQYRSAIASANRALRRLDNTPGDESAITTQRARGLYYLAASHLKLGDRERAQRSIEMFSDQCASLGSDSPWSQRIATLQQTILSSIPPESSDVESPAGSSDESAESL